MALKVKAGKYTGTGAALSITGLGFAMNSGSHTMLIIKCAGVLGTGQTTQVGTSEMGSTKMQDITGTTPTTGRLSSYDADGFTLGTNAKVNTNGETYYYLAITDTTGGAFRTGTYLGNATGPRGITGLGFQPNGLFIWDDLGDTGGYRTSDMATDSYLPWSASTLLTGRILSLDSGGFTVGFQNEVNGTSRNYYWAAFAAAASLIKNLSYTGNGSAAHAITGMGFQSDFIVSKGNVAASAAMKSSQESATNGLIADSSRETTGIFSSIDSNGFTLGTSANSNTNASVYYSFGFKNSTSAITQTITTTGISSGAAIGSPTVKSIYTIHPTGIASTAAIGSPSLHPGPVSRTLTGIGSAAAIGSVIIKGTVSRSITGIGSAAALGAAALKSVHSIQPGGLPSTAILGSPAILKGAVNRTQSGIASTAALGSPSVKSVYHIAPAAIAPTVSFGSPTHISGPVTRSPAAIASTTAIGAPALQSTDTLSLPAITSTARVGSPTLAAGPVSRAPTGISGTAAVGLPAVTGKSRLTPAGIASMATLGSVVRTSRYTVSLGGIAAAGSFGAPAVTTATIFNQTIAPGSIRTDQAANIIFLVDGRMAVRLSRNVYLPL